MFARLTTAGSLLQLRAHRRGNRVRVQLSVPFLLAPTLAAPLFVPSAWWARFRVTLTYLWRHRSLPRLARPVRYNEWVQWRKLEDRDVSLAALTDKLHAKALARNRIGAARVVPTLWHGTLLPASPPWPMPFIVKANHGCKQFVVVRNEADWRTAQSAAPVWLKAHYGRWLDEWHYRQARRTLLVEPFIGPPDGLPIDYKVFVFGGVAEFVQVHLDRAANHRWMQLDRNWKLMSAPAGDAHFPPPLCLAEMLDAAERIAGNRDHLRVDFYVVDGKLWFGECCLFPGSGLDPFSPPALDQTFGAYWSGARTTASQHRQAA